MLQTPSRERLEGRFDLSQATSLNEALARLRSHHNPAHEVFEVVLLDLALPDSQGLDTFLQVYSQASEVPIVVLAEADSPLALMVIREGAQDCLFKNEIDGERLRRSLLFAVERHRTWAALQHLCLTDDLTGLLNRRGFLSMADQQIKIAHRENWQLLLLFADLDGLKKINDTFGHPQGDQARRAEPESSNADLVARLGGDEFIVMAPNVSPAGIEPIIKRLQDAINRHNSALSDYELSLSWGVALFDPRFQSSLDEVIVQADQELYLHKRRKRCEPIP
jgi:diguanylate cyclase (GGDEF)-like protein